MTRVLGCGGTMATGAGRHNVFIAILGEESSSPLRQREQADPSCIKQLHARSKET